MDSYLNLLENGGTERSRARFQVRFMAIFVFHESGLLLYRGVLFESCNVQATIACCTFLALAADG